MTEFLMKINFSPVSGGMLLLAGLVLLVIFARFVVKKPRYIYATGVIINKPQKKPTITETKYEAAAFEADTMSYNEVKIDTEGNNHKFIENHRWVPLELDPEQVKSFMKQYDLGEEHPILTLKA